MKKSSSTNLYTGKEVFVGIDVHKRTYAVVVSIEPIWCLYRKAVG